MRVRNANVELTPFTTRSLQLHDDDIAIELIPNESGWIVVVTVVVVDVASIVAQVALRPAPLGGGGRQGGAEQDVTEPISLPNERPPWRIGLVLHHLVAW